MSVCLFISGPVYGAVAKALQRPGSSALTEAEALYQNRDYEQAAERYQQALSAGGDTPTRLQASRGLIEALIESGQNTQAAQALVSFKADYKSTPGAGEVLQKVARLYAEKGRYNEAVDEYNEVIRHHTAEPNAVLWARQGLALTCIAQGDFTQARTHTDTLTTAFDDEPAAAMAVGRLADVYHQCGHRDQARQLYEKSLGLARGREDLNMQAWNHQALAGMALEDKDTDRARAHVRKVLSECHDHPAWFRALSRLALAAVDRRQADQAVWICQEALNTYGTEPDAGRLWSNLAEAYITQGKHSEAQQAVARAQALPGYLHKAKYLFKVALRWENADRYDLAEPLYQWLSNHCPGEYATAEDLRLRTAKCRVLSLLQETAGPGRGRRMQRTLASLETQAPGSEGLLSKLLYQAAMDYRQAGRIQEAQDLLEAVIRQTAGSEAMEDLQFRALAYLALDKPESAEPVMQRLFKDFAHEDKYGIAIYDFGLAYYDRAIRRDPQSEPQAARQDLTRAITWLERKVKNCAFDTKHGPQAAYILGRCYYRNKQYAQARATLEQWVKWYDGHPETPKVLACLGQCLKHMMLEDLITEQEAVVLTGQYYRQLVTTYPDDPAAPMARAWLERRKSGIRKQNAELGMQK